MGVTGQTNYPRVVGQARKESGSLATRAQASPHARPPVGVLRRRWREYRLFWTPTPIPSLLGATIVALLLACGGFVTRAAAPAAVAQGRETGAVVATSVTNQTTTMSAAQTNFLTGDWDGFRTKLSDRGSAQATGVVTDIGLFLEQLAQELTGYRAP